MVTLLYTWIFSIASIYVKLDVLEFAYTTFEYCLPSVCKLDKLRKKIKLGTVRIPAAAYDQIQQFLEKQTLK